MGLFTPAWMTNSYDRKKMRKAYDTVKKIQDQQKLLEIFQTAPLDEVKIEVIKKLTDLSVLRNITKERHHHENVTKAAINRLLKLTVNDSASQTDLAYIAREGNEILDVRKAAINRLTDRTVVEDIVKNDSITDVRYIAVTAKLWMNQSVLADIAKTDKAEHVCKAALNKLTDANILDVAKNAKNIEIRVEAYKKIPEYDNLIRGLEHADIESAKKLIDIAESTPNAILPIWDWIKKRVEQPREEREFCEADAYEAGCSTYEVGIGLKFPDKPKDR